ncbi:MAG: LURP-one-related family protein [Erysipelotrichaceae bacterium]|nr:LURP-one-related family protein [Erysipelotrichaceae bacterium]
MKLLFRQRKFSWFDMYDIYDENSKSVYIVKGDKSWGHSKRIYQDGKEVARLRRQNFLFIDRYNMYIDNKYKGYVHKELTLYHPRFYISNYGWKIKGNPFESSYSIIDSHNNQIASIKKKQLNLNDTYVLDITNDDDILMVLMIVLTIDLEKDSRESSKMVPHYKKENTEE